jgi:tRNA uridine 5-carboxymethylaminomethyl modification enzyme
MTTAPEPPPAPQHAHPAPAAARRAAAAYDVLVVGGGHAGVEAVLAAARLGARAGLVTFRADRIGEMSCNPAIGGLGKGQLAREIDALGGVMGRAIDATGIQFRMLGTGKGYAVRAPRAQADRHLYREHVTGVVRAASGVEIIEGGVARLLVRAGAPPTVLGLVLDDGRELRSASVVLATGTFLQAVMHTGEATASGGRVGEDASEGLSGDLARLGLTLGRLKTGTPPRLQHGSIEWELCEEHHGDPDPVPFSFATAHDGFPRQPQIACHVTWTGARAHAIIAENVHRAPMYAGRIQGVGPRYCPSVEDKVMRFPERDRHQVYLEPEGLTTDVVYVNGVSTSLPAEVQEAFLREIPGLSRARFLRHGYAVEYDFVEPAQLDATLAVRSVRGLYLAGQINGTSGYEEAGAQGLLAGANAALWSVGDEAFVLGRHEAYAGVLVDDLVVSNPREPYRMFSSRAEYRLLLRQDNADRRLVRRAHARGLVSDAALARLTARERDIAALRELLRATRTADGAKTLEEWLRRPEVELTALLDEHPALRAAHPAGVSTDLAVAVEADVKYAGYAARQVRDVERMRRREATVIPPDLDLSAVGGLAAEAREKLVQLRPATLGAAARIAGVNPPDVALLAIHVERHGRQR